jgi:hypothetical protein
MAIEEQSSLNTLKQNLIEYVQLQLASQIIDLELDAEHYEAAYQKTIGVYRQRAQGAYEESYTFMELVKDVNIYTLPKKPYRFDRFSVERLAIQQDRFRQTLIRSHKPVSTFI